MTVNPFDEITPTAPIVVVKRERRRSRLRDAAIVALIVYAGAVTAIAWGMASENDALARRPESCAPSMWCGSRGCVEVAPGARRR